ncbi:Thioredoxin_domain-containing protein [Hexamita inflata]|uniref:Thioredoxin_domain-containing protein n=1 Tax=Hexamita inflata TaxID=28002 RepID=A0ABP1HRQ5_9EUKA
MLQFIISLSEFVILNDDNFDVTKDPAEKVIFFYNNFCVECDDKLEYFQQLSNNYSVTFMAVNCDNYAQFCEEKANNDYPGLTFERDFETSGYFRIREFYEIDDFVKRSMHQFKTPANTYPTMKAALDRAKRDVAGYNFVVVGNDFIKDAKLYHPTIHSFFVDSNTSRLFAVRGNWVVEYKPQYYEDFNQFVFHYGQPWLPWLNAANISKSAKSDDQIFLLVREQRDRKAVEELQVFMRLVQMNIIEMGSEWENFNIACGQLGAGALDIQESIGFVDQFKLSRWFKKPIFVFKTSEYYAYSKTNGTKELLVQFRKNATHYLKQMNITEGYKMPALGVEMLKFMMKLSMGTPMRKLAVKKEEEGDSYVALKDNIFTLIGQFFEEFDEDAFRVSLMWIFGLMIVGAGFGIITWKMT